jgi:hypothetical protein
LFCFLLFLNTEFGFKQVFILNVLPLKTQTL